MSPYTAAFIKFLTKQSLAARSVKLLEKSDDREEIETRDSWFNELRMEIRGHAKSLGVCEFSKINLFFKYNSIVVQRHSWIHGVSHY